MIITKQNNFIDKINKEKLYKSNESTESDLQFNDEAKRVYKKIIKNLSKIEFIPIPNKKEIVTVTDTDGDVHLLWGIKFNLQQLNEKYDLDILLVHELLRSEPHFDPKNNRLVFFILSQTNNVNDFENNIHLAKLRFQSRIDEITFIHEFIHYLDKIRYNKTYTYQYPKNIETYYNSPEEFNSYTHEIIREILKNRSKLKGISFNMFLKKAFKLGNPRFLKNLNAKYTKKLNKRLYQLYVNLNTVDL